MTVLEAFSRAYDARMSAPSTPREPRMLALATLLGAVLAVVVRVAIRVRREALTIAGLALLVSGAFVLGLGWGLAAAGVACFVLEGLLSE